MEKKSYFEEYLEFNDNYDFEKDSFYRHVIEKDCYDENDFDYKYVLNEYLKVKYKHKDDGDRVKMYDLEYNLIREFPIDLLNDLVEFFFNSRKYESWPLYLEINKYLFHKWNRCTNENPEEQRMTNLIQNIKNHLIETANLTKDEYNAILSERRTPKYYRGHPYRYYTHWLYCFYPLLDNAEELILKLINIVYINDCEEMLLYGIYHMEPQRLYNFMKRLLLELNQQREDPSMYECFDIFCSGTGAIEYFNKINQKLHNNGYNLLDDKDIERVYLHKNRNGETIDIRNYCGLYDYLGK